MGTALSKTADTWNEIINDNRGRQDSANKKSQEMAEGVVSHIQKYDSFISHYRQAYAPNRLYILPEHSVNSMHKDFIKCYPDHRFSYRYHQNKVESLNFGFVKSGEEKCEVWELHISHLKEEHMLSETEHKQSADGRKSEKVFPNWAIWKDFLTETYRNSNRNPMFLSKRES